MQGAAAAAAVMSPTTPGEAAAGAAGAGGSDGKKKAVVKRLKKVIKTRKPDGTISVKEVIITDPKEVCDERSSLVDCSVSLSKGWLESFLITLHSLLALQKELNQSSNCVVDSCSCFSPLCLPASLPPSLPPSALDRRDSCEKRRRCSACQSSHVSCPAI